MKKFTLAISLAYLALMSGSASAYQSFVLDFDADDTGADIVHGQIIDDEYESLFSTGSGVSISTVNLTESNFDYGVAFDSSLEVTRDNDLEDPFTNANGDILNPGNILIIQEKNRNTNCINGLICTLPDDEGSRSQTDPTGIFTFDFDMPVYLDTLDFFDVETAENGGTSKNEVLLYDENDDLIKTLYTPDTGGDNKWAQLALNTYGVKKLVVELAGSGAIDNLRGEVPAPSTIALMLLGLAGLSVANKRIRREPALSPTA